MGDKLQKGDSSNAMSALRDIATKLQAQAKDGQIDGTLLDQLGAVLDVAVDTASDPTASMVSDAARTGSTSVDTAETTNNLSNRVSMPTGSSSSTQSSGDSSSTPTGSITTGTTPSAPEQSTMSGIPSKTSVMKGDDLPLSGRPINQMTPPNLVFDQMDDLTRRLPEFIKALEGGQMKTAQAIAGQNATAFDTLFNLAQRAILTEGGWISENMQKLSGMAQTGDLGKAVTATSVPGYYLTRLAKLMLPVYAGLVQRLPTEPGTGIGGMSGTSAVWKAQLGFGNLGFQNFFRIAEANIGVNPPTSFLTFSAPWQDISANDSVTLKALRTTQGYSDPLQISVIKTMAAVLGAEERIILGANSGSLVAVGTVTPTGGSVGGVLAAGSYVAGVTALTYEGWLAAATGGSSSAVSVNGESAASYVLVSPAQTAAATTKITLTWPAVPGAVAYNVYLNGGATGTGSAIASGSAGNYMQTVLINKAVILTTAGSSANVAPASGGTDNSTYGMEGLIAWCTRRTMYGQTIASPSAIYDNAGAGLTGINGGIAQIDNILAQQWTTWHAAPSLMIMSPNMNATITGKLLELGSVAHYIVNISEERNRFTGGMMMLGYTNKFAPFADGTPRLIDVIPHPYMPDGTILLLCETIPYPMGNETRGFTRDVLLPYTYFPLPSQAAGVSQITYNYAITTSETVKCYLPNPQSAVVGVDYTL